jgi:hypothetical protein
MIYQATQKSKRKGQRMGAKKKAGRRKSFEVYGCFEILGQGVIERWQGEATSAAAAVRRAVMTLWRRPSVRWKHVTSANFTIQPKHHKEDARGESKPAARRAPAWHRRL